MSKAPMKLPERSLRATLTVLAPPAFALALGACNSAALLGEAGQSNPKVAAQIERAYEARDACLAKNAVPSSSTNLGAASVASAVALACMPETNRLIAVTNPYHDPRITAAILKDNDSKATRFVMLARGEGAK